MSSKDDLFSFGIHQDYADSTQRNLPKLTLTPDMEIDPVGRGVNPYDRDPTNQAAGKVQRTDLRKLSEWIKLQKQVEAQKNSQGEEGRTPSALPQVRPKS